MCVCVCVCVCVCASLCVCLCFERASMRVWMRARVEVRGDVKINKASE